ncbi:MAG: ComEC/Rec2 family competence protein, partial [Oscillospiraceae bacterium]|nr:ComEC/Rec2 family competence protein [Oscillospiraceae bacterium]
VSILFALCYALAGRQRYLTAIIGIPVLVLFAAVAGFTPSIIRACIMQSLMMIALLVNEEYDPLTALAFAVLVMLLLNPAVVASVNLQLSVGCMIGIIAFSKRLSQAVLRRLGWPTGLSMWARFARGFSGSVGVTISAMSLTIPLTSAYFGMVSVIGVFANIIALWVISFIFYGILFACTLAAVLPILGKVIAWIIAWPARYVLCVAELCASVPFAAVYTSSIYIVIWIVICYLIFLSLFLFQEKPLLLSTACAAVCLCAAIGVTCFEARQDELRITAFDVGEGQAVLIQCEGYNFLVDCGGDNPEEAADMVAETLLNQGVFTLDGLILTHYDADHAAGVMYLLSRVDADVLYLPRIADNSSHKAEIVNNFEDKIMWIYGLTEIIPGNGRFSLIPAVSDANDPNESSLCVLFQREEYDILITGDRGYAGEKALIESYDLPKLELLIAGHHGAKTSTCFELLSVTQPETVVISTAGRYGHPNEDVLYRLSLFDCNVLRTDQEGTLIFRR